MKYHYDSLSKTDYSAKDIEKSMTILELVRWCVTSQVSLNVLTGDTHTYLNYNPRDFKLHNIIARSLKTIPVGVLVKGTKVKVTEITMYKIHLCSIT